jgi:hypothetical protein
MTDARQENRPRIGANYPASRLLILGESVYSWEENGEIMHPDLEYSTGSVDWAIESWGREKVPSFMECMTRALARKYDPNEHERHDAWASCAFTNYANETVGYGAGTRPTREMWERAKKPFLALLEELKPLRIVVTGKEMWRNMPDTSVHLCDDIKPMSCLMVPSHGRCVRGRVGISLGRTRAGPSRYSSSSTCRPRWPICAASLGRARRESEQDEAVSALDAVGLCVVTSLVA